MKKSAKNSNSLVIHLNERKETLLAMLRVADKYRELLPIMMENLERLKEYHDLLIRDYEKYNLAPDQIEARKRTFQEEENKKYWEIIHSQQYVEQIDATLNALPDEERIVLEIFGDRRHKGDSIARAEEALHCGKSQVYRLKDRALLHMLEIIYATDCETCPHPCEIRDKTGTCRA